MRRARRTLHAARATAPTPGYPRALVVGAVVMVLVFAGVGVWWFGRGAPTESGPPSRPPTTVAYVGSQQCATCHQDQSREWQSSQHAAAMTQASDATVKARFDGSSFSYAGTTSTFYRRDSRFYVRTDGADGQLADFEIVYTLGVAPLQQYLIKFPGGRLQALSIAWDTRPAEEGGQRWMHLYPRDAIRAGDSLHWTGLHQNWNFMCADCHSTNVAKGYNSTTREFQTSWSEISVGCESCHGPGSEHVTRARAGANWATGYGLTARLDERRTVRWTWDDVAAVPVRSEAKTSDRETDVCARCHARRAQVTDRWRAGDLLEDGFRPAALETLLFHADGQQRDEVYTHGSFLQSRMYAKGVTCSDCHDPHSGRLRLSGNGTCTQCHATGKFDVTEHHLHRSGTAAAACVACHMPTTTYMVIDPRHDHSFRVPRPDRTVALGVPNACTSACHADRPAQWAAAELSRRNRPRGGHQTFAEAFAAFDRGSRAHVAEIARIAADREQPAVVRAGALTRIAASPVTPPAVLPLQALLGDGAAIVRRGALQVVRRTDAATRLRLAPLLLTDRVRTVRIEAARALMDVADSALSGSTLASFESAFRDLVAEQQFNADRPEGQLELGSAWLARGRLEEARAAFREAIALDRTLMPAYANLAEATRMSGSEVRAEEVLRAALVIGPSDPGIHHALGLSLVRQKRIIEALAELREAARLDPSSARYGYVLGVALKDTGRLDEALTVLAETHARHPEDRDTLIALALYHEDAGRKDTARRHTRRLLELNPADPAARGLAERLGVTTR
jgi:tetratricopeptide (TPR) repeat protein